MSALSDMEDAARRVKMFQTGRMARHQRDAMILSEAGKIGEQRQLDQGVDYSDQHVRLSAVHARQDLVLMVSYLDSLNATARSILRWVTLVALMALVAFIWTVGIPMLKASNLIAP